MLRVGHDFYLANSTFSWFPGIPIFHSRDLVHWTQIGNAIDRPSQLKFDKTNMWQGVYAPDLSWHDGIFYLLNTCTGCGGNYLMTARNPAGPWSDPVWLPDVDGIDTSLFFDDDGRRGSSTTRLRRASRVYEGHTAIWLQELDLKSLKTVGPHRLLIDSGVAPRTQSDLDRGSARLQEGRLLLFNRGGRRDRGRSFGGRVPKRARRRSLRGLCGQPDPDPARSFEGSPEADHLDRPCRLVVTTPNGDWWSVFLGVRPCQADEQFQHRARDLPDAGPVDGRMAADHCAWRGDAVGSSPA